MSFESCIGALEDAGGSLGGLWQFISTKIGLLVIDTLVFPILTHYIDLDCSKKIKYLPIII